MTREERNELICKKMEYHLKHLLYKTDYEVMCVMLQGSQNYELDEYTDEYQSDVDTKAIVLPHFRDFVYGKSPVSTTIVLDNNEHIDVKDIRVMFENFRKMNVSYIELLYSNWIWINPRYEAEVRELLRHRDTIAALNRNQFIRCIAGMSMEKRKALCHPYPNLIDKIEKYGYDGKQLSHCVRLFEFLERYLCGVPLEECYVSQMPETLMNYKKQLTKDGSRIMTKEEAIELCELYDNATRGLKDGSLTEKDEINQEAIDILNNIKYNVLKKKFIMDINQEALDADQLAEDEDWNNFLKSLEEKKDGKE